MESYKKTLKVRMLWWWIWWSLAAFMFFGNLTELLLKIAGIGGIRWGGSFLIAKVFVLILFGWLTFRFFPSTDKLLEKDLRNETPSIYAKALILERKLEKYKKQSEEQESNSAIEGSIQKMEAEIAKHESEKSA